MTTNSQLVATCDAIIREASKNAYNLAQFDHNVERTKPRFKERCYATYLVDYVGQIRTYLAAGNTDHIDSIRTYLEYLTTTPQAKQLTDWMAYESPFFTPLVDCFGFGPQAVVGYRFYPGTHWSYGDLWGTCKMA